MINKLKIKNWIDKSWFVFVLGWIIFIVYKELLKFIYFSISVLHLDKELLEISTKYQIKSIIYIKINSNI